MPFGFFIIQSPPGGGECAKEFFCAVSALLVFIPPKRTRPPEFPAGGVVLGGFFISRRGALRGAGMGACSPGASRYLSFLVSGIALGLRFVYMWF